MVAKLIHQAEGCLEEEEQQWEAEAVEEEVCLHPRGQLGQLPRQEEEEEDCSEG